MKLKILMLLAALVIAAAHSGAAFASGVDTAARDRLSSMANATDPYAYYSSSGAHIGLGSFSYRVQNPRAASLFSRSAPSVNTSCNGWDIFAGSFSILSADRILQTLRSMASAIPMVAFRMAMAWLSQQLESITGDILDQLMKFNQEFQSGCQIQETLLDGFKPNEDMGLSDLLGEMGDRLSTGMQTLSNQFRNVLSRTEDRAETVKDPEKVNRGLLRAFANSDDQFIHRNWIWEIMKTANLQTGGNSGTNIDLAVDLISMTGATQQCWVVDGRDDCLTRQEADSINSTEAGTARVAYRSFPPTLTYREFLEGQTMKDGQKERVMKRLVCEEPNEDPPCLLMRTEDRQTALKGMEQIVHDIFLGPENQLGQGIIGRSELNEEPTPFELRMLSASGQYGRMLMEVRKKHGEQMARNMAAANTKGLANEIAFGLLTDLLQELNTNIEALDAGAPVQSLSAARELVDRRMAGVHADYLAIAQEEATQKGLEDMRAVLRNENTLTGL